MTRMDSKYCNANGQSIRGVSAEKCNVCKCSKMKTKYCKCIRTRTYSLHGLHIVCVCLLIILIFCNQFLLVESQAVNVALNKPITALYTCGDFGGIEEFYNHSQRYTTGSRILDRCTKGEYPPSAMVDGNSNTWWQSTNRTQLAKFSANAQATITINLLQVPFN